MSRLIITRGYPGSGKTSDARDWLARGVRTRLMDLGDDDSAPRARSNRDDLRLSVFGRTGILPFAVEQHITDIQQDTVRKLLKRGYDVIVDDMNLRRKYAVAWANLAHEQQAEFRVWDCETDVDTCVERDRDRGAQGGHLVGEDVIREIAAKFPIGRWPEIFAEPKTVAGNWDVYTPPSFGPSTFIVDIDGTVAKKQMGEGQRGWHEYDRVGEDVPNQPVIEVLRALLGGRLPEERFIFVSGRKDYCRDATRWWLHRNVGKWTWECELYMRADDDNRSDDIVKYELFNAHIRDRRKIVGVFDDRDRVVAMWRAIGLQVYQVADGNF